MVEQNLSWCTLFDLQMCLIKSKETNAEFEKQIVQLKASKENISQRLQELRSSSSQETIEQLLEDREVIALSQERDDNLSKQQVLTRDLQSVKTLLNKFKLDIDRSNKSIQRVEVCNFYQLNSIFKMLYMFLSCLSCHQGILDGMRT